MKKLKSTFPNMLLSLGLVSIVAAALLAGMYLVTKEPIAQAEQRNRVEAIKRVAPEMDNDPVADAMEITTASGTKCTVFPAYLNGKFNGAAVSASTMEGFGGEIQIMAGFNADGTVKDYQVLSHAETPGLGSKMQEWFSDPTAARSVIGKSPADVSFYVVKDKAQNGQIDGITAATISSRAFLGALREAFDAYTQVKEQKTGNASAKAKGDGTSGASTKARKDEK
ncbi:MAG: RnfABCDGE type electron transport complex subunit G [Prevotella sp.]|nr:RnfABCDGE type electron transport complex subunit G [Prevotella sp.]MCM1074107.1 RnfABCDGE type electron transport complex subunit G [Ruminococcus sp.]